MAAVAVTRSRLISWTHIIYSGSSSQRLGVPGGQTQVPPLCEVIDAEALGQHGLSQSEAHI
jgi:hypothetical protein